MTLKILSLKSCSCVYLPYHLFSTLEYSRTTQVFVKIQIPAPYFQRVCIGLARVTLRNPNFKRPLPAVMTTIIRGHTLSAALTCSGITKTFND